MYIFVVPIDFLGGKCIVYNVQKNEERVSFDLTLPPNSPLGIIENRSQVMVNFLLAKTSSVKIFISI